MQFLLLCCPVHNLGTVVTVLPISTVFSNLRHTVHHWQAVAYTRIVELPSKRVSSRYMLSFSPQQSAAVPHANQMRHSWAFVGRNLDKQKPFPLFNSPRGLHNPYSTSESEGKIIQLFSDALVHSATESDIKIVSFYSTCYSVLNEGGTNFWNRYILLRE